MNINPACQYEPREELIGGRTVMMLPASSGHTYAADGVLSMFKSYLKGKTCVPFGKGLLVHLTEEDAFVPDVMVVCDRSKIRRNGVYGAPDLVVEVLSPSTAKRDRGYKKSVYERCGVTEYWIVDPSGKSVETYLLREGRYELDGLYTLYPAGELEEMLEEEKAAVVTQFKCHLYDDLTIRLEDIFGDLF